MVKHKEEKKHKVAVYGTLRKGMGNHSFHLGTSTYLGEYETEPIYNMYSINEAYPALTVNGNTSIYIEVYEVTAEQLQNIDYLEGYDEGSKFNHYNRISIDTPFGKAFLYIYDDEQMPYNRIKSGNWKDYINKPEKV